MLRLCLMLVIGLPLLLLLLWALRWQLFGGLIRRELIAALEEALNADVSVDGLSGSLVASFAITDLRAEPRVDSQLLEPARVDRVLVRYRAWGLVDGATILEEVVVEGFDAHWAGTDADDQEDDAPADGGPSLEPILDWLRQPGGLPRVRIRDAGFAYGRGSGLIAATGLSADLREETDSSIDATLTLDRLQLPLVPDYENIQLHLDLDQERLRLTPITTEQAGGLVAHHEAGSLALSGELQLRPEPLVDLHLRAHDLLVLQDEQDTARIRADADLTLTG
ncbi:MAG: hypothetical protein ACOCXJ_04945, partial [Planctomycetota bacterium]